MINGLTCSKEEGSVYRRLIIIWSFAHFFLLVKMHQSRIIMTSYFVSSTLERANGEREVTYQRDTITQCSWDRIIFTIKHRAVAIIVTKDKIELQFRQFDLKTSVLTVTHMRSCTQTQYNMRLCCRLRILH